MNFRCNYRKCRKELSLVAIVTSCSHIFCSDHSPGKLVNDVRCPVCKTSLNQTFDFVEVDLQPNDAFKGMVLTGLRPETIIEIAARALGFWMYQMEQELQYNQYLIKKHSEKAGSMESEFMKAYGSLNEEKNVLLAEKENLSRECEELREKLIAESRLVEKITGEQKFLLSQSSSKNAHSFALQPVVDIDRQGSNMNKFFPAGHNIQTSRHVMGSLMHKSGQMMISPDSTFGSPSKCSLQKTDQANRVWGIGQYHNNNLYHKNDNKENQQNIGRRFLSPLENILNQKSQLQKSCQRRLLGSIQSTDSSQISFGYN